MSCDARIFPLPTAPSQMQWESIPPPRPPWSGGRGQRQQRDDDRYHNYSSYPSTPQRRPQQYQPYQQQQQWKGQYSSPPIRTSNWSRHQQ